MVSRSLEDGYWTITSYRAYGCSLKQPQEGYWSITSYCAYGVVG